MKILSIVVILCAGTAQAQEAISEIYLVSEEWNGATNADGTGLYWDIIRKVYEPEGINVAFTIYPYMRAVKMVQAQRPEADALVGSYMGEIGGTLYPQYHFDVDVIGVMFRKDRVAQWDGQHTMEDKKVGWMRGYSYNDYLDVVVEDKEVSSRESGVGMVERERLDFFLDPLVEIEHELAKPEYDGRREHFQIENALELKMYLAFANDDKGRELVHIFDQRMEELIESGELKSIYEKWDYAEYPFD